MIKLNLLRHAFYKLGNSQEESILNCDWFDKNKDSKARALKLLELIANCNSKENVKYVKALDIW